MRDARDKVGRLSVGLRRVRPLVWILIAIAAALYFLIPHYFWTRAKPIEGGFNVLTDKTESALSSDGQVLIIAREVENRGSDLYMLEREGKRWGPPRPLVAVNTPFNETDPELSEDGRFLFMASDRPGGGGGYDLWVARRDGDSWQQPLNLGWGVNSRFDEFGPAVSHSTNRIIFSSNRPEARISVKEKNLTDKELRRDFPPEDLDLYSSEYIGTTIGKPVTVYALRDRRQLDEDLAIRLGGSPGTEAAVKRAIEWMAGTQEQDGRWAIGRHGGQAGHDVAATALTLLAMMGHGHKHTDPGPYREHVDKGLKWLVKQTRPNGDMRSGNSSNGMYDQGMGAMALAEAYGLTKDESLKKAAQAAIDFIVAAQHKTGGGWRYQPGQGGDMSVFGWQVMAINNALNAGLHVPAETLERARKWLNNVGTGEHGGLYGYRRGGKQPAMVAEGMFCRQLLRSPRSSDRMNETAKFLENVDPRAHGQPFYYFIYYATLGLYHHHIDYWDTWNGELKDLLLDSQVKTGELKGSWKPRGAHGGGMGRLLSTALATLSLEIYYRYLPRYEFLEPEMADIMAPGASVSGSADASIRATNETLSDAIASVTSSNSLVIPLFGAAWSLAEVNTPAHETQPAVTADGKTLFFASSREEGRGGADLYVAGLDGEQFGKAKSLRGYLNSTADETDPVIAANGVTLLMSSNRESSSGARYRLYRSEYRRVTPITFLKNSLLYLLSLLERIKWWLLVLLFVLACILYLAKQFADPRMRERYNLLQKCILGSILAHLLILLLTAFWKISTEVVSPTDERLEIAIDVNALAQEALALDIREDISELPEAESATLAEQLEAPAPVQEIEPVESQIEPIQAETLKEVLALEAPELESPPEVVEIDLPEPDVVLASVDLMETAFELEEAPTEAVEQAETPETPQQETLAKPIEQVPESRPEVIEITTEPVKPPEDLARMEIEPVEVDTPPELLELEATPLLEQALAMQLPEMEVLDTEKPEPEQTPEIEQMARRAEQPDAPEIEAEPVDAPLPSAPAEPEAIARTKALLAKLLEEADLTTDVEPVSPEYTNLTLVAVMPTLQLEEGKRAEVEQVSSSEPQPRDARRQAMKPSRVKMEHGEQDSAELPSVEKREKVLQSMSAFADRVVEESRRPVETLQDTALAMVPRASHVEVRIDMERREPVPDAGRMSESMSSSRTLAALPDRFDVNHGGHQRVELPDTGSQAAPTKRAMPGRPSAAEASTGVPATLLETTLAMVRSERPATVQLQMETPAQRVPVRERGGMRGALSALAERVETRPSGGPAQMDPASAMPSEPDPNAIRRGAVSSETRPVESSRGERRLERSEPAPIKAMELVAMTLAMESVPSEVRTMPAPANRVPATRPGGSPPTQMVRSPVRAAAKAESLAIHIARGIVRDRGRRTGKTEPTEGKTSALTGLARISASPMEVTRPAPMAFQLETRQAAQTGDTAGKGNLIVMATAGHVLPAPSQQLRGRAGRAEMIRAGVRTESLSRVSRATRAGTLRPVEGHTSQPGVAEIAFAGNPDVPVTEILDDLILDTAPASLQPYYLRDPGKRGTVISRLGGGSDTETAVRMALNWFTTVQEIDGRWSITRFGGQRGHDAGATGFVLLSYLGWGAKHTEKGPFGESLSRGLDWLKAKMKDDGDLRDTDAENAMYSQGIAALAMAEAYALTKDETLREPAQRAINFIVAAQNAKDGSWRYHPGDPGDTSVLGWQLMALTSARLAGLEVPEDTLKKVTQWLRRVGGGDHGGLYGYRNNAPVPSMVAEGMFCRQLLGTTPDAAVMKESARHISANPVNLNSKTLPVYYYTYYGTLALHQHQGPAWHSWNDNVKRVLLTSQARDGEHKGSWEPKGLYAERTGRLVSTAMATLTLEVYYRYLPLYTFAEKMESE